MSKENRSLGPSRQSAAPAGGDLQGGPPGMRASLARADPVRGSMSGSPAGLAGPLPHGSPRPSTTAGGRQGTAPAAPHQVAEDDLGIPILEHLKSVGDALNNRFLLEHCIGAGSAGKVYRAIDLRLLEAGDRHPYVAVRVFDIPFRTETASLAALQREVRTAHALTHPNIVATHDFDRDGATLYMTMEYHSGKSMREVLRAAPVGGMRLCDVLPIAEAVAAALAYGESHGVRHGNLRASKVFLTDGGQVKLLDFGIHAGFAEIEAAQAARLYGAANLRSARVGEAAEAAGSRAAERRGDVAALAALVYEMLTGHVPAVGRAATRAMPGLEKPAQLRYRQWRVLRAALRARADRDSASVSVSVSAAAAAARLVAGLRGERRASLNFDVLLAITLMAMLTALAVARYRSAGDEGRARAAVARAPAARSGLQARAAAPSATESDSGAPAGPEPSPVSPSVIEQTPSATVEPVQSEQVAPAAEPLSAAPAPQLPAVLALLARIRCAALDADVRGDSVTISGLLPPNRESIRLRAALLKLPGIKQVDMQTRALTWRQCAMVNVLAPYRQQSRLTGLRIRSRAPSERLREGDSLQVELVAPMSKSDLHVDYYVFDGRVVHLLPSLRTRGNLAAASSIVSVGKTGEWVIAKPFGNEIVVAVATPAALFDQPRPRAESAAAYLRALDQRLAAMDARYGPGHIAVEFLPIVTQHR